MLRGLRDQHAIVPAVEEWRELTKLLNTYLEPLPEHIDPRTGRLHTTFKQTVAATGRLSSVNPNLQNIPVRTDLGSRDPRLLRGRGGLQAGGRRLLADRAAPHGLHGPGAGAYRSLSPRRGRAPRHRRGRGRHPASEQVTKQQRERAKATNFGIMYGLSAFGLSEQVGMPVDEARAFIDAYFDKYPRVREFRERVIAAGDRRTAT